LLDTTIAKIVIRKSPKEKEERSALIVFGFWGFERQTLDHQIHEGVKVRSLKV
jgi:hypothetical protein